MQTFSPEQFLAKAALSTGWNFDKVIFHGDVQYRLREGRYRVHSISLDGLMAKLLSRMEDPSKVTLE